MLKNLRNRMATLFAALSFAVVPVAVPVVAYAQPSDLQENLQCGTTLSTDNNAGCDTEVTTGSNSVKDTIKNVINIFSAIVGIVSVIMIIYGGFKYISSGGDSGNVSSAKNTIIYAIIGLIVVAMAQFLTQFVLDKIIV